MVGKVQGHKLDRNKCPNEVESSVSMILLKFAILLLKTCKFYLKTHCRIGKCTKESNKGKKRSDKMSSWLKIVMKIYICS